VRIRITLASNDVLTLAGSTYELSDISFTVDTISINDGMFNEMHQQFLRAGNIYELPFKNWLSFSSTGGLSQSTNFSVSSQSVNRAFACFVNKAGVTQALDTDVQNSTAFIRYGETSPTEKVTSWGFQLGSRYYPNFRPTVQQSFALLQNNLNLSQDVLGGINPDISTMTLFQSKFWAASMEFCHSDNDFISGVDTRGNASGGTFETQGISTGTYTCLVFLECSSILRVGEGRQVDVVM
jgi:hypothetical protein